MNPKIFVIAAIIGLGAIIAVVLTSGSTIENLASSQPEKEIIKVEPIAVALDDISVTNISERSATIEIKFKLTNPNPASMIVQVVDYQLYETNFSENKQISGGQLGSRPEGMVEFGSNYYTLLGGAEMILKDKVILKNNGNIPELWSSLESNTANWKITGDVFYNLSSMTSGQENELHFELTA
ncbi:hypothetical protein NsoK4_09885 [Nitrosopumilus sp. K4]|uniref:hypothetical protein n=1 Tax=Nitrosopumilus sp. K4 TaxID=2795383 RepID=UPI001BAB1AD0|nr:hypothetical protein [Nitrosopumilus sp. K4]QUC64701.1 hypothetical protein NsoK4_09885 [Nitrosopumilus sp. K4]